MRDSNRGSQGIIMRVKPLVVIVIFSNKKNYNKYI